MSETVPLEAVMPPRWRGNERRCAVRATGFVLPKREFPCPSCTGGSSFVSLTRWHRSPRSSGKSRVAQETLTSFKFIHFGLAAVTLHARRSITSFRDFMYNREEIVDLKNKRITDKREENIRRWISIKQFQSQ